jgi:hypothetical protein
MEDINSQIGKALKIKIKLLEKRMDKLKWIGIIL